MKHTKLAALLVLGAVLAAAFGVSSAEAATYKTTLTLTIAGSSSGYDEAYILTVPEEIAITASGWTSLGSITVSHDTTNGAFNPDSRLVVDLSSQNGGLAYSPDKTPIITYTFRTEEDGSDIVSLDFSAEEIDTTGGTSKAFGVYVADFSTYPAGDYEDYVVYTADIVDADTSAAAITWNTVDLSTLTAAYTAQNYDMLTGTLGANVKISIAAGATVALSGATITGTSNTSYNYAGITCEGDTTIILSGDNTVKGFFKYYPGIRVAQNSTLTISGDGKLTASSNGDGAGIGGGYHIACGSIDIQGGTIIATGGSSAAGIGSGWDSSCGSIDIHGGTITATGGSSAAGIGSGYEASCGDITITTGVTSVTATKGQYSPNSIGAGNTGTCGTVTIEDGANVIQN